MVRTDVAGGDPQPGDLFPTVFNTIVTAVATRHALSFHRQYATVSVGHDEVRSAFSTANSLLATPQPLMDNSIATLFFRRGNVGSPERRGFRYCTVCCSLVALLKGPHNNPTNVYRHFSLFSTTTGRHVLTSSPAGIGCGGCHRGAEMRPGCALGVPSVRGRGLLRTTGGRPGSTVPFVVRPQSLPLINTMGGRAGLGLRVTHSDPYALQKERERERERGRGIARRERERERERARERAPAPSSKQSKAKTERKKETVIARKREGERER